MSNGSIEPLYAKDYFSFANPIESEFSSQLEVTLNNLLEKYEDTLKNDFRAYYGTIVTQNNVTKVRHKRGIPEIHMSKKGSNTQLRPCNDMNGMLGTFIPKRKVGIKISKIGICQIFSYDLYRRFECIQLHFVHLSHPNVDREHQ